MCIINDRFYSLQRKIACKIHDEHYLVKDMAPPNETVAKMMAKTTHTGKLGKCVASILQADYFYCIPEDS